MAWLEQYRALARYNRWMNDKLYAGCEKLSDQERKRDRGAFFKSIHGTLNHLLLADGTWMGRFTGDENVRSRDRAGQPIPLTSLAQELYSDFDELRSERRRLDDLIIDWTYSLDDHALTHDFSYRNSKGQPQRHALWWAVGHFFNHQTHHRGQVTTLLSQQGVDVGVTDLVWLFREESERALSGAEQPSQSE